MNARPRITWVEATHGDPELADLWAFLSGRVAELFGGRADVRMVHAPFAAGGIRTTPNRLLSDVAMLTAGVNAAGEADALVLGCWGAPTAAVRDAVGIPVASLAEASAQVLAPLASTAAVVTVAPSLVHVFEADLAASPGGGYLSHRPVRSYLPESTHYDVLRAVTEPGELISRFDRCARDAVEDGADAIVVGCGYLGAIFGAHGYESVSGHPDVPVIDCNRLAVEHVLLLLSLAEAGIRPTARGHARPVGGRARALADFVASVGAAASAANPTNQNENEEEQQ